jgi:hypothetical protein
MSMDAFAKKDGRKRPGSKPARTSAGTKGRVKKLKSSGRHAKPSKASVDTINDAVEKFRPALTRLANR